MHVIATAGHVDHGKSTLIRSLTTMEPDRWAEERRRGLTIDLGFAWTELGQDNAPVAFVDVPGHERFVPNMLAGVGPVPAVLFVVAADEGWMPQSAEHLAALDALGVRHGVLAITRSDIGDAEIAAELCAEEFEGTSLAGLPTVAVSGTTGEGLGELRTAVQHMLAQLPAPDAAADLRLWVDRSFTISGAGTVVTGTLAAGSIAVGDELELRGRRVTVRGLQSQEQELGSLGPVRRVAVNLRGLDREQVTRGDALLAPDAFSATDTADVLLRGADAGQAPEELVAHVGSAACSVRVRPLFEHAVRLQLDRELPLRVGDRVLLRDPGAHRIVAGADVVDVAPVPLRRRGAAAALGHELLEVADELGADLARAARLRLRHQGFAGTGELYRAGLPQAGTSVTAYWQADPSYWKQRVGRAAPRVRQWCAANPLQPGMPEETLRRELDLPDAALLPPLLTAANLSSSEGRVRTGDGGGLPDGVRRRIEEVTEQLRQHPFSPPNAQRMRELKLGRSELAAAERAGMVLVLAEEVVVLPDALHRAAGLLADLPSPFSASQAKEALASTRRVAVPLLEAMDRAGWTRRLADSTRELRGHPREGPDE